jgi:ABC-type multidrug transport system permease subunit
MPSLTIAAKDLRLLLRDPRSAVILVVMPLVLILVLGLALGEAFGRQPDDRLQLTVVDEDRGLSTDPAAYPSVWRQPPKGVPVGAVVGGPAAVLPLRRPYPPTGRWADVVLADMKNTGDIKIERVATRAEAEQLVRRGKRSAVVIFEPEFSAKMDRCSFVEEPFKRDPINPMNKNGVRTDRVGVTIIANDAQRVGPAVTTQLTQVSLMRVVIPWMIGQAFDWIGSPLFMERMEKYIPQLKLAYTFFSRETLGAGIKKGIQGFFENYDFTAPTWHGLTKDDPTEAKDGNDTQFEEPSTFGRGTRRYQVLVPSYAVTFAFFLVLTAGWLFAAERRHGTLVRLEAAPIGLEQLLLGKLIPCLVVSVIQGLVLLAAGWLVFGMSWGPQPLLLLPVVACTSFAAVGVAVLVGAVAKTEAQVSVYGTLLVMVLAGMSGSMMPREMMPDAMKQWSKVTPHAWALEAYEHLLQPKATTVDADVVWTDCGVLAAFGAGFLLIAWAWMVVGRKWGG